MARLESTERLMEQQKAAGLKQIQLCPDGKYRWYYELDMWRNPTILITTFKVFFIAILVMGVILLFIGLINGNELKEMAWIPMAMLIVAGIFVVLVPISYALLGFMYGGRYKVRFEMDENGILHQQLEDQAKRGRALGCLTAVVGLLARKPTVAGSGMLAASRSSSYSTFDSVTSVKAYRNRQLIKVNEPFCKNQIYVSDPDDFEFVYKYICAHCSRL